jgi:hypothetical protein
LSIVIWKKFVETKYKSYTFDEKNRQHPRIDRGDEASKKREEIWPCCGMVQIEEEGVLW